MAEVKTRKSHDELHPAHGDLALAINLMACRYGFACENVAYAIAHGDDRAVLGQLYRSKDRRLSALIRLTGTLYR